MARTRKITMKDAAAEPGAQYVVDAWQNPFTGMGIAGKDKNASNTFAARAPLGWQEKTNLYRQNWIAKRLVDDIASDATRKGWQIGLTEEADDADDTIEAINQALHKLHMDDVLRMGLTWGLVYGGAVGLLLTDDTPKALQALGNSTMSGSLTMTSMPAGGQSMTSITTVLTTPLQDLKALKRIWVVDARYALPDITQYDADEDSPNFGLPLYYTVTPYGNMTNTQAFRVHWSRLVRFNGVPTDMLTRVQNLTWGDSIFEAAYDPLSRYGAAFAGASMTAAEFNNKLLKMKGFTSLIVSKDKQALMNRLATFKMGLSAFGLGVVDADGEDLDLLSQPVTGLPDLLDRMKQEVAGAVRIPQSRLWGNQAGKVAGAENDREMWCDWVHGWQQWALEPVLRRIIDLLLISKDGPTGGQVVDYSLIAHPIDPPNLDAEIARREKQAKIDQTYYGMNALESSEIRISRFGGSEFRYETTLDPTITESLQAVDLRNAEEAEKEPEAEQATETEQPEPTEV